MYPNYFTLWTLLTMLVTFRRKIIKSAENIVAVLFLLIKLSMKFQDRIETPCIF